MTRLILSFLFLILLLNFIVSERRELDGFIKDIQKRIGKPIPFLDFSGEDTKQVTEKETVSSELMKLIGRNGDEEIMNYDIDDAELRNDFAAVK